MCNNEINKRYYNLDKALNDKSTKELILDSQDLETLPDELEKLQDLEYLSLDENNFKEIPKVIFKLIKLNNLSLYDNKVSLREVSVTCRVKSHKGTKSSIVF